ncbi:MAG: alpha-galactosidase, partial [Prevotella sp.]|nr:alpha-galactosidase [Prevotella sp.]
MKKISIILLVILCFVTRAVFPQQEKVLKTETGNTTLIYIVDNSGRLVFRYYGTRLADESVFGKVISYNKPDTNRDFSYEAYPTNALGYTNEPALAVIQSDRSMITELAYLSDEKKIDDNDKTYSVIYLKDKVYNLLVELHTEAYKNEDVIAQWVIVRNNEKDNITLKNIYSSFLNVRAYSYYLTHFNGVWAGEMNRVEEKLDYGIKSIESKKGVRTTQSENPSFILSLDHPAQENSGICYGGALAWSGNYKLSFQVDEWDHLNILSGINPYLSDYILEPGKSIETPKMIYTFSDSGQGQISRNFHDWSRKYALNKGFDERPIVLNSWEGAYFDFDEKTITDMIDDAARLGVEMFVLDDG